MPASAFAAGIPSEGDLRTHGPVHLAYLAAATQASGRLVLASEEGNWALTYRRGVVEHAAGSRQEDDLATFLVQRGLLTAEAAADARQIAQGLGGDVLSALVELHLLDPAARFPDLKEHGAALAYRALACEDGAWRWEPGIAPPALGFPLGSRWGILVDAARRIDPTRVRERLGVRGALSIVRSGGRVDVADLMLNPQEARAVSRVDGVRSADEMCALHPAEADVIRRAVLLLAETELATFGAPRLVAPPPPPAAPPPRPAPAKAKGPPPAPAPAPAAPPPQLEPLQATAKRLRDADHFEVLGVPRDAETSRLKAAFFALARTYHPDAAKEGEPEEARALRAEIFARVAAAWAALETDEGRSAYLAELRSGGSAQVDIGRIYQAEQAFEKVAPLAAGRAYADALARVNEAIALYADEPEYHAWKAWLEFLVAPEPQRRTQRTTSEKAIEAALQKSPKCVPAWLFLGRMAKVTGDVPAAERAWKRGLEQVNDAELERELRFLKR